MFTKVNKTFIFDNLDEEQMGNMHRGRFFNMNHKGLRVKEFLKEDNLFKGF